jgi:hypothetical protein
MDQIVLLKNDDDRFLTQAYCCLYHFREEMNRCIENKSLEVFSEASVSHFQRKNWIFAALF